MMSEWIKCSDKLPTREENVLIMDKAMDIYVGHLSKYSDTYYCYCNCKEGSDIWHVTHWMPLPEPPKDS